MSSPPDLNLFGEHSDQGFTLMEVMVVLVLVSLISTLLLNGFSFVMNLRMTFLTHQENQIKERLFSEWFQSVTSVFSSGYGDPDYQGPGFPLKGAPEIAPFFDGTRDKIYGLTLAPLSSSAGRPQKICLEITTRDDEVALIYSEGDQVVWTIGRWKAGEAGFAFLGREGKWQETWPPDEEDSKNLPEAVLLTVETDQGTKAWLSRRLGRADTRPSIREIFGDL